MKERYEELELEVLAFGTMDILTTSPTEGEESSDEGQGFPVFP